MYGIRGCFQRIVPFLDENYCANRFDSAVFHFRFVCFSATSSEACQDEEQQGFSVQRKPSVIFDTMDPKISFYK